MTARELAKCEARKRVFSRLYAEFDALRPQCREAHRQLHDWSLSDLRRCFGHVCNHVVTTTTHQE